MQVEFHNLYDSHVHLQFTAEKASTLNLNFVQNLDDLKSIPSIDVENFRGEILTGFGWSQFKGAESNREIGAVLDKLFPDHAIFFTRKDGHAALLNTQALRILNLSEYQPGLFEEDDHFLAYRNLPAWTTPQIQAQLFKAQKLFLNKGFTHIRDMTMTESVWQELEVLSSLGQFKIAVEAYVHVPKMQDLEAHIEAALRMKKTKCENLRLRGLKFFYDGTLGAETALLSCGCGGGLRQWTRDHLALAFKKTWEAGLEVAIHTIGDLAVDEVVEAARSLSAQGHLGRICLEHVEVVRPETIQKMKALHVEVHMQPCHFLSDRNFLKDRLGKDIVNAFPWSRFERAQIQMHFGSDSPIESPDFFRNQLALKEAKKQFRIDTVKGHITDYHTHPDKSWWPCQTLFENETVKRILIGGKEISEF